MQEQKHEIKTIIVGIMGASSSGKDHLTDILIEALRALEKQKDALIDVVHVSQDDYYKKLTPAQCELAFASNFNFDCPEAFDNQRMINDINNIRDNQKVVMPKYCFETHSPLDGEGTLVSATEKKMRVIIVTGLFIFELAKLREMMKYRVYIMTDSETRLKRRILRDTTERGRDLEGVLTQYDRFVKPAYKQWIKPNRSYAHIFVPYNNLNAEAIELIVAGIFSHY